jgi:hypothetical protein
MKKYSLRSNLKEEKAPVKYIIDGGKKCFITTEKIQFKLSDGVLYEVEEGFRFDGATVPRVFWWYLPRLDDRVLGVIIHDHMYMKDYLRDCFSDKKARLLIDKEWLMWCKVATPKEGIKNKVMYQMVRLFGAKIFKR